MRGDVIVQEYVGYVFTKRGTVRVLFWGQRVNMFCGILRKYKAKD